MFHITVGKAFLYPGEGFKGKQGSLECFYTEQWHLVIKEHIIRNNDMENYGMDFYRTELKKDLGKRSAHTSCM